MAQHSVNYRLKTNERYISEMERSRPLSEDEENLIRTSFKEQFTKPMYNWALIQKDSKRNKLFTFLRSTSRATMTREFRPLTAAQRRPELVIRSPNATIDFNRAIFGDVTSRPLSRQKFESREIKNGIFGNARPYTAQPEECVNYGLYIAKKLLEPSVVQKVQGACQQNENLLVELLKWAEKKTNEYPIDPIRKHPELNPVVEGRMTKAKLSEDHVYSTTHKTIRTHPLARTLKARDTAQIGNFDAFWSTNYQDNFCDEFHSGKMPRPQQIYRQPVTKNPPYCVFPADQRPVESAYNELIMRQSQTNRELGRINYQIFNAKTCL